MYLWLLIGVDFILPTWYPHLDTIRFTIRFTWGHSGRRWRQYVEFRMNTNFLLPSSKICLGLFCLNILADKSVPVRLGSGLSNLPFYWFTDSDALTYTPIGQDLQPVLSWSNRHPRACSDWEVRSNVCRCCGGTFWTSTGGWSSWSLRESKVLSRSSISVMSFLFQC